MKSRRKAMLRFELVFHSCVLARSFKGPNHMEGPQNLEDLKSLPRSRLKRLGVTFLPPYPYITGFRGSFSSVVLQGLALLTTAIYNW